MNITLGQLLQVMMPATSSRMARFVAPLNAAMAKFEITTEQRIECFLAQCAHESGRFQWMAEIASGQAYEGRKDLGNTEPGDGRRYKGRGPIQVTGKENYIACMMATHIDCVAHPELLERPEEGCMAAAWFWHDRGLNVLADSGDFERITRRINGGLNGEADRLSVWELAKKAIV